MLQYVVVSSYCLHRFVDKSVKDHLLRFGFPPLFILELFGELGISFSYGKGVVYEAVFVILLYIVFMKYMGNVELDISPFVLRSSVSAF